jgi:hypothetical protein
MTTRNGTGPVRDYAAEYARRIARGLGKGLTRAQARGHPRPHEHHLLARITLPAYDKQLEEGLKAVRNGKTLNAAARSLGVSPERLRHYLAQTGVMTKQRGRWVAASDLRLREVLVYSDGQALVITVAGYERAALIGRYMAAVGQFLRTNDPTYLEPFVGDGVEDIRGARYLFETRPNILYRLTSSGLTPFEQVYRIVA